MTTIYAPVDTDDDVLVADCGHPSNDPVITACGTILCSDDCHTEHLCACRACATDEAAHADLED